MAATAQAALNLERLGIPVEGEDAAPYQALLGNLQANILKTHGRDHTVQVFLRFTADATEAAAWISRFTRRYVTSARRQLDETRDFQRFGVPGGLIGSLLLSANGYEYLGLKRDGFGEDDPEQVGVTFRDGMVAAQTKLGDPDPTDWEEAYASGNIHAMILLADEDETLLLRSAGPILQELRAVAEVLGVEHGRTLRNKRGDAIEHFGYVDGRSQPLFLQDDINKETLGGTNIWDPSAPLKIVLVADPHAPEGVPDCFGSYVVFRKLEQNVFKFKGMEKALARELRLPLSEAERVGALIVGRFEDGTPVTLADDEGVPLAYANNFTYDNDQTGARCPFQAHIRKTNPRGDAEAERAHRIARRGITYGKRAVEPKDDPGPDDLPSSGVGLLFLCYQSSIPNQFAFMQARWANHRDFAQPATGLDPIIGQPPLPPGGGPGDHRWPVEWKAGKDPEVGKTAAFAFDDVVTMQGGEFFFAPSIPFLLRIGDTNPA